MSKKKRRQPMTSIAAPKLPYLYDLPADLPEVKVFAMAQAMNYARVQQAQPATGDALHTMAVNACFHRERTPFDGKCGTNNAELFRQTFIAAFCGIYPLQVEGLRQGILPTPPEGEQGRWAFYCVAAQHYLQAVEG